MNNAVRQSIAARTALQRSMKRIICQFVNHMISNSLCKTNLDKLSVNGHMVYAGVAAPSPSFPLHAMERDGAVEQIQTLSLPHQLYNKARLCIFTLPHFLPIFKFAHFQIFKLTSLRPQCLHRVGNSGSECPVPNCYPCHYQRYNDGKHKYADADIHLVNKVFQPVVHGVPCQRRC